MIRIRTSTFETNSSSSHTIVFGNNYMSTDITKSKEKPFYFPVEFFTFGSRGKEIYMDISRKFSFFFQSFIDSIVLIRDDEKLFDNVSKTDKYGKEYIEFVKTKEYQKLRQRIVSRYKRLIELLQMASEKIREERNIRLDFSDMALTIPEEEYPQIVSKTSPLSTSPALSTSTEEKMSIKTTSKLVNELLMMDKKEYDMKKLDFSELREFLIICLDFAFSTNCVIIEGEGYDDEEFSELMTSFLVKNDCSMDIFSS